MSLLLGSSASVVLRCRPGLEALLAREIFSMNTSKSFQYEFKKKYFFYLHKKSEFEEKGISSGRLEVLSRAGGGTYLNASSQEKNLETLRSDLETIGQESRIVESVRLLLAPAFPCSSEEALFLAVEDQVRSLENPLLPLRIKSKSSHLFEVNEMEERWKLMALGNLGAFLEKEDDRVLESLYLEITAKSKDNARKRGEEAPSILEFSNRKEKISFMYELLRRKIRIQDSKKQKSLRSSKKSGSLLFPMSSYFPSLEAIIEDNTCRLELLCMPNRGPRTWNIKENLKIFGENEEKQPSLEENRREKAPFWSISAQVEEMRGKPSRRADEKEVENSENELSKIKNVQGVPVSLLPSVSGSQRCLWQGALGKAMGVEKILKSTAEKEAKRLKILEGKGLSSGKRLDNLGNEVVLLDPFLSDNGGLLFEVLLQGLGLKNSKEKEFREQSNFFLNPSLPSLLDMVTRKGIKFEGEVVERGSHLTLVGCSEDEETLKRSKKNLERFYSYYFGGGGEGEKETEEGSSGKTYMSSEDPGMANLPSKVSFNLCPPLKILPFLPQGPSSFLISHIPHAPFGVSRSGPDKALVHRHELFGRLAVEHKWGAVWVLCEDSSFFTFSRLVWEKVETFRTKGGRKAWILRWTGQEKGG